MIVQLGNSKPVHGGEESVTSIYLDDATKVADSIDVADVLGQVFRGAVTNLPNCEALLTIISPNGIWKAHSLADSPSWAWSDNANLQEQLCQVYNCPAGTYVNMENN